MPIKRCKILTTARGSIGSYAGAAYENADESPPASRYRKAPKRRHAAWLEGEHVCMSDLQNAAEAQAAQEAVRRDEPIGLASCPFAAGLHSLLDILVRHHSNITVSNHLSTRGSYALCLTSNCHCQQV